MLEYVAYGRTVTDLPIGTRVVRHKGDTLVGTVTSAAGTTVGVQWDNGGTSSGPASHGLWIVREATPTEYTYEADLCGNCVVWHFNADDSGMDASDPRPMRYWDEDATVGAYTVELVEDEGEPVQHFSHRDCDGCGAIAGTRYEAIIHYTDLRTIGA